MFEIFIRMRNVDAVTLTNWYQWYEEQCDVTFENFNLCIHYYTIYVDFSGFLTGQFSGVSRDEKEHD